MSTRGERVVVLTGCTASGKTAALLHLARTIPIEVVSADSRQIYRGMDIGTSKPSPLERELVPHHLVDILDPDGYYSAGDFARDAALAIESIRSRGRIPVVAGGTVLYLIALRGGFDDLPRADTALRHALAAAGRASPGLLSRMLKRLDPASDALLGPADSVRRTRAIEIAILSGKPASSLRRGGSPGDGFLLLCTETDRAGLRRRIAARTSKMFSDGLVEETRRLVSMGFGRESAVGRTIGYSQVLDSLEGRSRGEDLPALVEAATWRYARRQRNMIGRLRPEAVLYGPGRELAGFFPGQEDSDAEGR